jgi:hypothetical protein
MSCPSMLPSPLGTVDDMLDLTSSPSFPDDDSDDEHSNTFFGLSRAPGWIPKRG